MDVQIAIKIQSWVTELSSTQLVPITSQEAQSTRITNTAKSDVSLHLFGCTSAYFAI